MKYADIVDYSKLDPFKKMAVENFVPQFSNTNRHNIRICPETIGEPAIALDFLENDFLLAFNVEGLGTKNIIADQMALDSRGKGFSYYESVGIDTVAMSTNDLSSIGADPIIFGDIISSGDSAWFENQPRAKALLKGFQKACDELGIAIPCGETPTLKNVVFAQTVDLAGASIGIIKPKTQLTVGNQLKAGDAIIGISSSGLHANGISLVRKIAEQLPDGYFTELPQTGKILGEAVLTPTHLYSKFIVDTIRKTTVHYMQPITGHGWEKISRHKKPFSYEIGFVPEPSELFSFLQSKANLSDKEAYCTWNMGIGYALFAPQESVETVFKLAKQNRFEPFLLGTVQNGNKQVKIKPKNVVLG